MFLAFPRPVVLIIQIVATLLGSWGEGKRGQSVIFALLTEDTLSEGM